MAVEQGGALVCLPTYNERENLVPLLDELLQCAAVDVLVIDDNSPDGTGSVAAHYARREPRVQVLARPGRLGLGSAYLAGFRLALARGYRFVVEMDADFSHQPRHLPELLRAIDGADLVLGSRYIEGGAAENWGLGRRALARGGSRYARSVLGLPYADLTSGFKVFRREVLEAIELSTVQTTGYAFQIELTYRAWRKGFRVKEVPIVFFERTAGRSKLDAGVVAQAVTEVWRMRWRDR
ncbi:MAG: polyprenol monophosphomannose synthase [Deltaproteobacteria bacterium]|nr:polyprenol monophosphomannose synthase [Deltaproteobacteria bacterium]